MRKKESQDFIFPEVGISGLCTTTTANTLIAASNRLLIAVVHLTINIFRQFPAFTCYVHCSIISCHFIHSLLMTHLTSNNYYTLIITDGVGQPHIHLQLYTITPIFFTIITYVGGSNGVNTGPMKHQLTFLNNTNPI